MSRVYVVTKEYPYEGRHLLGAFDSMDGAKGKADNEAAEITAEYERLNADADAAPYGPYTSADEIYIELWDGDTRTEEIRCFPVPDPESTP